MLHCSTYKPQNIRTSLKRAIVKTKCVANSVQRPKKIGIIGAGGVGSAIASSLIHKNITSAIWMNDVNTEMCQGVAYDLEDEAFFTGTQIYNASSVSQLNECDIIVITAGAKQQPNEPRTNLIKRNVAILSYILSQLFPLNENTIIVVVSNPVDILTSIVQKLCAQYIPKEQVIGSGTYLDSQRIRVALSKKLNIAVKSVHAYVLGEHGDSQVFAKSVTRIGGCSLDSFKEIQENDLTQIENNAKYKAYEIIKRKGSTFHGIGECVATICESIVLDKNEVMPVSAFIEKYDTYVGWPVVLGANGVQQILPLELAQSEEEQVAASAALIKKISLDAMDIVHSIPLQ
jgi:L-lactate dehydrogenase